jgi:hypothetical protein
MVNLEFDRGSHICHLFRDQNERKEVALRFLKVGLDRGECCALVVPDSLVDAWQFEIQTSGIDVVTARDSYMLNIIPGSKWRQPGEFNSLLMAQSVLRQVDAALVRAPGVRFLADMAWAHESALRADQLCHWEASSNLVLEYAEVRAICQYDLASHPPVSIHAGLRTHPIVIFDGRRVSNPFYEAPRILEYEPILNSSDADAASIETMLSQLSKTSGQSGL